MVRAGSAARLRAEAYGAASVRLPDCPCRGDRDDSGAEATYGASMPGAGARETVERPLDHGGDGSNGKGRHRAERDHHEERPLDQGGNGSHSQA